MVVKDRVGVLLDGRGMRCDSSRCIMFILDRSSIVLGGLLKSREKGLIGKLGWKTGKVLPRALITHTVQQCFLKRLANTATTCTSTSCFLLRLCRHTQSFESIHSHLFIDRRCGGDVWL